MSVDTAFDASEYETWEELAHDLHHEGGVSKRRADAVAVIALGYTYAEAKEILGMSSRGQVRTHVQKYLEETKPEADWLAENGPTEAEIRRR